MKKLFFAFLVSISAMFMNSAEAGLYIRPFAGASVPVDGGDISYQLGGTLGYGWNQFVATEVSYAHWLASGNGVSGNQTQAELVLGLPLAIVKPYVSGGAGLLHVSLPGEDAMDPFLILGAGVSLFNILFLSIDLGADYIMVQNQPDYVQPYLSAGISF